MIDLALRENSGPVALAAISQRQQISLSYLEQLFGKLRRHELVESTRGPGGGYSLGRKSDQITVADIIVAVDEPIDATGCGGKENCMGEETGRCITHELWTQPERQDDRIPGFHLAAQAGGRPRWPRASRSSRTRSSGPFLAARGQADPHHRPEFRVRPGQHRQQVNRLFSWT